MDYIKFSSLHHSGIKGMKWGIRRYQNADGTLTDAGKVRYNKDGTKKTVEQMSNRELEEANNRLTKEQNYNRLVGDNYKNRSSNMDIAVRAGASAVGSAMITFGAYSLKDAAVKSKKGEKFEAGKTFKTAGMLAALAATVGAVSSVATSLGGQVSTQNIGDQGGKKK